ncbi:MAG: hypothetical protein AB7S98_20915, partial [Burkholderiaceae bacterium]
AENRLKPTRKSSVKRDHNENDLSFKTNIHAPGKAPPAAGGPRVGKTRHSLQQAEKLTAV